MFDASSLTFLPELNILPYLRPFYQSQVERYTRVYCCQSKSIYSRRVYDSGVQKCAFLVNFSCSILHHLCIFGVQQEHHRKCALSGSGPAPEVLCERERRESRRSNRNQLATCSCLIFSYCFALQVFDCFTYVIADTPRRRRAAR